MNIEKHSLAHEFPELRERITELKTSDQHFARLFAEYDAVEHTVHRIETGAEVSSDAHVEELKKKRLGLKDELFKLLNKAA